MGPSFLPSCDRRSWLCAGDCLRNAAGPGLLDTPEALLHSPPASPPPLLVGSWLGCRWEQPRLTLA